MNKGTVKSKRDVIRLKDFLKKSIKEHSEYKKEKRRIIYKYLSAPSAYKVLKGVDGIGRQISLKYSKPYDFDDLFECHHILPTPYACEWVKGKGDVSYIKKNDYNEEVLDLFWNILFHSDVVDDETEELIKSKVVSCFSERWDNVLMWSLYAEKYYGCVIGFDSGYFKNLKKVRYVSGNTDVESEDSNFLAAWRITTKFHEWSWQEEWRDICNVDELNDQDKLLKYFDKKIVKEIYLGKRTKDWYQSRIISLAKKNKWIVRSIDKSAFIDGNLDSIADN